jgi:ectoine hydroxylase-related dioxygenase (phytanoyl-CoA dioxygenase family)
MKALTAAQRLFWEAQGYLLIEDALTPDELAAYRHAADEAEARWRRLPELPGCRIPAFEEIEGIMEYDTLFLDLLDHPRLFPLIREVLGPDIQMIDHAYYITPPGGGVTGSAWHSDVGRRMLGVDHSRSVMMVRLMIPLEDVTEDGGATLLIPGSHRFGRDVEIPKVALPEEMPGALRLACKAGSAYFFNGNLFHSPSNNRSPRTRRMLLFNYGHRFMRMWKGHEPSAWLQEQAATPMRKQLLGMWRAYYGPDAEMDDFPSCGTLPPR